MQIWLVRHAIAAERDEFEGPDAERPLTARGRKQFRSFVRWLETQASPPRAIITSPALRAVQTAEILRKGFGLKKREVAHSEPLSPGAEPTDLIAAALQATIESVAVVGHEPDLGRALSEFVGGGEFAFGKGYVAAVEFAEHVALGRGQLRWFVGPTLT